MNLLPRVGYVLKRYPHYSETFVVNEILALEQTGLAISIFSLRTPEDGDVPDAISRVRAPVVYHVANGLRGDDFWRALGDAGAWIGDIQDRLRAARGMDVRHVYRALRLACDVRRLGITHLHAHLATEAIDAARLAAWFASVPCSFTAHANDSALPASNTAARSSAAANSKTPCGRRFAPGDSRTPSNWSGRSRAAP